MKMNNVETVKLCYVGSVMKKLFVVMTVYDEIKGIRRRLISAK